MGVFDESEIVWGQAGIPGTGLTEGEKLDITTRLTDLEAVVVPSELSDMTDVDLTTDPPASGDLLQYDGTDWVPYTPVAFDVTFAFAFIIDGGGATITTGIKGDISVPFDCTLHGWRLLADQSGSIVVRVERDTYANYPPLSGDQIDQFTISGSNKADDTTGNIAITAGDTIRFEVTSVTSLQRVGITIPATRSIGP